MSSTDTGTHGHLQTEVQSQLGMEIHRDIPWRGLLPGTLKFRNKVLSQRGLLDKFARNSNRSKYRCILLLSHKCNSCFKTSLSRRQALTQ